MAAEVFPEDFPRQAVIEQSPFPETVSALFETKDKNEQITLLEEYIARFDEWLDLNIATIDKERLTKVLYSHEKVIEIAKFWLDLGGKQLATIRQKSKVIMAYADNLPKRLSRYRPLKG